MDIDYITPNKFYFIKNFFNVKRYDYEFYGYLQNEKKIKIFTFLLFI